MLLGGSPVSNRVIDLALRSGRAIVWGPTVQCTAFSARHGVGEGTRGRSPSRSALFVAHAAWPVGFIGLDRALILLREVLKNLGDCGVRCRSRACQAFIPSTNKIISVYPRHSWPP